MKGMLAMQRDNRYKSKFDEKEYTVDFSENTGYFSLRRDGADVGILQTAESDARFVKSEAAFLFGNSPKELYFRFAFDTMMEIVDDDDDISAAREMLFRTGCGSFWSLSGLHETDIPVYHNALGIIAQLKATHKREHLLANSVSMRRNLDDGELIKDVESFVEKTIPLDIEIEEAVNSELEKRNARVISVCRFGDGRLYPYYVAQISDLVLVIVVAHLRGDWLAEENDFGGEGPLWFSESEHAPSPVSQARRVKDFLSGKMSSRLAFGAIVACPHNMTIINAEDESAEWEKANVKIAWTKPNHSEGGTLHNVLDQYCNSISGDDLPADYELAQSLTAAFNMNPENFYNGQ